MGKAEAMSDRTDPDYLFLLRQLPRQLQLAGKWDKLEKRLTDLFFLEAKAEAGMVFELAADFRTALQSLSAQRPLHRILQLLKEALLRDIHFITEQPTTLFQCLWNLCWWYDSPEAAKHYAVPASGVWPEELPWTRPEPRLATLLESWRSAKEAHSPGFCWLRSHRPPKVRLGSGLCCIMRGHEAQVLCVAFSPEGRSLASGSSDRGEKGDIQDYFH
jgi:hypothetical protein